MSQYFCDVFARWVPVFVAGAALWTWSALFCVAGAAHLEVSCCVFCANRIVRAPSSGDKVQIPWQAWRFVRCDENWRGSLAPNIDFEVANLEVHKKTRRKTSSLKLQSVKFGGSLARNVRSDAPTCLVSSLWLSCGLAVSMGEAAKPLRFEGFQAGCHVVLRHMRGRVESRFVWQAQYFCVVFTRWVAVFVACAAFWRLHTPQSTPCLYTSPSTLYIPHFTLYTLHTTLYTPHSTLHPLHSTLHTSHSTLHTLHFTLYTLHSTLHTLHFTLHTLHSTFYTPHFTLYTLRSTLYTPHFTLHTLHSRLYTPRSTFSTPPSSIFHSLRCTGMVTGEKCTRLFKKTVSQKCSTWLHIHVFRHLYH